MTGPPYPHQPYPPGSNAIGYYQIGVSPLGSIAPFDPWATLLSQYANSPVITTMITEFNAAMDLTIFSDSFYDLMWNIQTAQGYGLDSWGRIVGVTRTLNIPSGTLYFGFQEAFPSTTGFGQAPFYGGQLLTTNFVLGDADFRRYILAKAAVNICGGGIPAVNAILLALFQGRGVIFVADGLNMTCNYIVQFTISPVEVAILSNIATLVTAAGVAITITHP